MNFMNLLFHLISKGKKLYLFDARTYSIIEIRNHLSKTLKLLEDNSYRVSKTKFLKENYEKEWKISLSEMEKLISNGFLSTCDDEYISAPSLKRLVLMLTDGCNLACKYCFERDKPSDLKCHAQMSSKTAVASLEYLLKNSPYQEVFINLYGGEPLLNFRTIKSLIEMGEKLSKIYNKQIKWFLVTNGTLINQKIANFIKDNKIGVQVSIDGSDIKHNIYRTFVDGRQSYDLVKKNIKKLEALGVCCNLLVVLTKANVGDLRWLEELKKTASGKIAFCIAATDRKEVLPTNGEWEEFISKYELFLKNQDYRQNQTIGTLVNRIKKGGKLYFGCGGGLEELTVSPTGEMYLCERLDSISKLGISVFDGVPPNDLWRKIIGHVNSSRCKKCWLKYLCGGGCSHTFRSYSKLNRSFKWHCKIKQIEAESAITAICKDFYHEK